MHQVVGRPGVVRAFGRLLARKGLVGIALLSLSLNSARASSRLDLGTV